MSPLHHRTSFLAICATATPRRLLTPPPSSSPRFVLLPLTTVRSTATANGKNNDRNNNNMSVATAQEAAIKRNPHPDFKKVEASRPDWDRDSQFRYTKTVDPNWQLGSGANGLRDAGVDDGKKHVCIDPYEAGRPAVFNYKLLISGVVPRPIGFVSTQAAAATDGSSSSGAPARNLAPFSWFNMVNHDPPLFALGVAATLAAPKDTLRNLLETKECVVSIIGEDILEAANATSVDAPYGASEWDVSGLTPVFDTVDVKAPRVKEAVFSVECRLESVREFESRATPGKKTGCLVVLEGTRFWVREDALNDDRNLIDPAILRPISRLGGITYARVREAVEIQRPSFKGDVGGEEGYEKLKGKGKGNGEDRT